MLIIHYLFDIYNSGGGGGGAEDGFGAVKGIKYSKSVWRC